MSARGYEEEAPEVMVRTATIAGQLLASATAFFFLAFVFGYFYLRSLNNDNLWHPKGVDAPVASGTAIMVLVVMSAVAVRLAVGSGAGRPLKLGTGFGLGVAALVVQVVQWSTLGFGPTNGGYASVFVGWTGCYFAFALIALLFVEVQLANAIRKGGAPDGLGSTSFYWSFLAGIGVLTWVVLYLV